MKFLTHIVSATAIAIAIAAAAYVPLNHRRHDSTKKISSQLSTGATVANFLSAHDGLDGPKLSTINSTSFDWWYFDAVSPDAQLAISVIFFTSVSTGFPLLLSPTNVTSTAIFYTFANGTNGVEYFYASDAIIETSYQGSSGVFTGSGTNWNGSPDLSTYRITLDSPTVSGIFHLTSNAPAHYPCAPVAGGQTMLLAPHIGWSNAIPDADADVDLTILGSKLQFTGSAYHDKVFRLFSLLT